jgi:S-DNA-T family DNA segregation ATPase FtsK/SpoIIIE
MSWHVSSLHNSSSVIGEEYQHEARPTHVHEEDEDDAAEAELARQFAATQQQRYSGEQPAGANPFSLSDFEFSPMKDLVDDGPSEPLFTQRDA